MKRDGIPLESMSPELIIQQLVNSFKEEQRNKIIIDASAPMNQLQVDIFNVITSMIALEGFVRMYQDHTIRYCLLNYIAKYSLARGTYLATEASLDYLDRSGFLRDGKLRRGLKSKKNKFTYEHPIPSNVIGRDIIENRHNKQEIAKILEWSDRVTILTSAENGKFSQFKLTNNMPDGWKFFSGNPFARYLVSGICIEPPALEIVMTGQIIR